MPRIHCPYHRDVRQPHARDTLSLLKGRRAAPCPGYAVPVTGMWRRPVPGIRCHRACPSVVLVLAIRSASVHHVVGSAVVDVLQS